MKLMNPIEHWIEQAAGLLTGLALLSQAVVSSPSASSTSSSPTSSSFSLFSWIYGFGLGAYHYALKMFVYQRVRARNFARAWSFVQASQAIPLLCGIPLAGTFHLVNLPLNNPVLAYNITYLTNSFISLFFPFLRNLFMRYNTVRIDLFYLFSLFFIMKCSFRWLVFSRSSSHSVRS